MQETNRGMRAGRDESGGESSGRDGKDDVQQRVYWMRRVALHSKVSALACKNRFLPSRRNTRGTCPPSKFRR